MCVWHVSSKKGLFMRQIKSLNLIMNNQDTQKSCNYYKQSYELFKQRDCKKLLIWTFHVYDPNSYKMTSSQCTLHTHTHTHIYIHIYMRIFLSYLDKFLKSTKSNS